MKFNVSIHELIKTDEIAPWNPNEFVFKLGEHKAIEVEGKTYDEGFEKVKSGIEKKGWYSISLRNIANTNNRSKSWRIEIK